MNIEQAKTKEDFNILLREKEKEREELKQYYSKVLNKLKLKQDVDLNSYLHRRKEIEDKYNSTKSWDEVITTVVYCDDSQSNEAFIDIVENMYNTKVKDAKHLQELTGIAKISLEDLRETIYLARQEKFYDVLNDALNNGAKYIDLLKYEPKDYGLPDSWEVEGYGKYPYRKTMNRDKLIKRAIHFAFSLGEPFSIINIHPDLRTISEILEAPYSLILESYNYYKPDWQEVEKKDNGNHSNKT